MAFHKPNLKRTAVASLLAVSLAALGGLSAYSILTYGELQSRLLSQEERIAILGQALQTERLNNAELKKNNDDLAESLRLEKEWSNFIAMQFKVISGTVGTLTKLSQTDPELLAKYSKVYFLNENYVPSSLAPIDSKLSADGRGQQIHSSVLPFLNRLVADAKTAGADLRIVSAYRSFEEQASVKTGYKVLYGSGANRFSADQGYSEHQLGTTLDFVGPKSISLTTAFESTSEFKWLSENAHRYGFILSYPKGNAYYQYEPWHWRFVGVALATHLHDQNLHFYDMSQRDINEYLVKVFD